MRIFLLNKRFLNWFKNKITNWFLNVVLYFELKLINLPFLFIYSRVLTSRDYIVEFLVPQCQNIVVYLK